MSELSVIIITKNEAANIRACLESVSWAEEIIVVDSGSTDETVTICQQMGAQVHVHDWPGFGLQKNRALGYASKDWVLSLDADERVTPELRAGVEGILRTGGAADAYLVSRLSNYCGRFMRHSGWYPDMLLRLFKRDKGRFSDDLVHERLIVEGCATGTLSGTLLHYAFDDLEEVLHKVNQYSSAGAKMMQQRGRRATLFGAVVRGLWSFFRTYILRGGILDGGEGFMLAVSNAEGTYYRYLKLILLNRKS